MSFRFDIEKFDGRINFGLWQVQVKDILIQSGLYKALKGKPASLSEEKEPDKSGGSSESKGKSKMSEEEWEELDMRTSLLKIQHCRFVEMGRRTNAPKKKLSAGDVGNLDI